MASALMPLFTVTCVLLVTGGAFKLRAPRASRESLALAGARVSERAVRLLGAAEIVIGIGAAIAPAPLPAAMIAVAYGGFCGLGIRLLSAGYRGDCGCFAGAGASVGATHLVLNAIGSATALLAVLVHPPGLGWMLSHAPLDSLISGVAIAAGSFAVFAVYTLFPSAWSSYRAQ